MSPLLSDDHFLVDDTLLKAWATMKSVQRRAEETPPDDDPCDPPVPNADTDPGTLTTTETVPIPRPSRHSCNAEFDLRGLRRTNATHGSVTDLDARLYRRSPGTGAMLYFIVQGELTRANGHADLRAACVTHHVAQRSRHFAIDGRTTRHNGYAKSQRHANASTRHSAAPRPLVA